MAHRESLLAWVQATYGTLPEYPWRQYPAYAVLRHAGHGKWYGLIMDLPRERLNLPGTGRVDVVNLKTSCAAGLLVSGLPGVFPAYHMNKQHWITLALEGGLPDAELYGLVAESYALTR
ncbi:MmcQ/YjbR family DNA-binding protein [uncultured Desulfovibrio sp.]|uniref:MmcQ/YjbR family DNA-binding protein n=1 Tax=uncultured Desulfovibrio sp. TaxID=167968 RepID=UPI00260BA095|nr:MmcQ/YjbR family DNA-binding protein [uncultured Desulfovibrio sp.]